MQTFREKKLLFDFPDDWQVVHYDVKADPVMGTPAGFYRHTLTSGGVSKVQAVDFVCRLPVEPASLQLLEVKDDRLDTSPEGERRTKIYEAVMGKVAGTVAGLLIAERLSDQLEDDLLRPLACLSNHPAIEIVLFWLEPPAVGTTLRKVVKKDGKAILQQRLAAKLRQWNMEFALCNLTDPDRIPLYWNVREV